MPTLHWIGKDKVINHHREVPYKVLEHGYGFDAAKGKTKQPTGSGNKVIHGDNLEALKSLLPEYEGKVKCIYIDPPYNTGNEGWVYNDNVNDPRIKKWLGDVVGKEGEDLSRHDKWLCMMYPRLVLLHKLLAEDGSIWISIDDNEVANLRLVMDEVFGPGNFMGNVVWQKKYASANDHKGISPMHDHVLVYQRSAKFSRNLLPRTEENDKQYRLADDKGVFRSSDYTCNKNADERPNLYYPIIQPNTNEEIWPKRSRVWGYSKDEHFNHVDKDLIYWGKDGMGKTPAFKRYKDALKGGGGTVPVSWWAHDFASHTDAARKEVRGIFEDSTSIDDFPTPKPTLLLQRVLQIATDKNSIILDSFAGSGTTAHAVLNLNKQDDGNRKFILIEMMDYAETITAERVKRVMQGYPSTSLRAGSEGNKKTEGTGGAFDYYTLGAPLFDAQQNLNEAVGVERIREYIWYSETRAPLSVVGSQLSGLAAAGATDNRQRTTDNPYFLGMHERTAYYFVYEAKALTTLDHELLGTLPTKGERTVIYADNCLLSKKFLERHGIVFKKIPRDISRF